MLLNGIHASTDDLAGRGRLASHDLAGLALVRLLRGLLRCRLS